MANIARRGPWSGLMDIRDELDRLFGNTLRSFDEGLEDSLGWRPVADLEENEDEFIAKVELPGVKKDDVKISISGNEVRISGEVSEEKEAEKKNYYVKERIRGRFDRGFRLPTAIDSEKAEAKFKNGVLELTLPKEEKARPKEIDIKEE